MSLGVIVLSMVVATVASLMASARERRAAPAEGTPSTPVDAAEAVAEQKGTPPTVEGP